MQSSPSILLTTASVFAALAGLVFTAFVRFAITGTNFGSHDASWMDSIRSASSLSWLATYALFNE